MVENQNDEILAKSNPYFIYTTFHLLETKADCPVTF